MKNKIHKYIDPPDYKSKKAAVNDYLENKRGKELNENDVLLDSTEYRIAYRDIARPEDERTAIAAVLPKGIITYTNLTTIRPYDINPEESDLSQVPLHGVYDKRYTDKEIFVLVGLINSLPFDFLIGEKTDKRIATYSMLESQAPKLRQGDKWFDYIAKRAARLNCYGEEFEEMRERLGGVEPATKKPERKQVQAEIDAAASHAFGLDHKDVRFILENFHRVQNPRIMTDEYFTEMESKFVELDDM